MNIKRTHIDLKFSVNKSSVDYRVFETPFDFTRDLIFICAFLLGFLFLCLETGKYIVSFILAKSLKTRTGNVQLQSDI